MKVTEQQKGLSLEVVRARDCFTDKNHGFIRHWGVSRRLTGSTAISMGYGKLDVGKLATAHSHDVETAIRILRGKVCVRFGGTTLDRWIIAAEGDFMFIPPNVLHCPEVIGNLPMEYVVSRNSPIED